MYASHIVEIEIKVLQLETSQCCNSWILNTDTVKMTSHVCHRKPTPLHLIEYVSPMKIDNDQYCRKVLTPIDPRVESENINLFYSMKDLQNCFVMRTNLLFTVLASESWWTCTGEVLAILVTSCSILTSLWWTGVWQRGKDLLNNNLFHGKRNHYRVVIFCDFICLDL